MSRPTNLFRGVDTTFGLFFQKHHILAFFSNFLGPTALGDTLGLERGIEMEVECHVTNP